MGMNKSHFGMATLALALIFTGLNPGSNKADAGKQTISADGPTIEPLKRVSISLPEDARNYQADQSSESGNKINWRNEKVRKGDSLARIFDRAGLSARTLHDIMASAKEARVLSYLRAGQSIQLGYDHNQQLVGLRFSPLQTRTLETMHGSNGWQTRLINKSVETRLEHAGGTIHDSLFLSGSRAGLNDNTIMQLAGIFGWDIDFALDIRRGDHFSVIYETRYLDGEKIGNGEIIAAEFTNRGKRHQAIRYTTKDHQTDYYSPDGRSMRKAFLRTPVKFSRISSRFTGKRWHPVLKRWRAHKGVDYAAPRGTPVKATSNGKITFRGRKGGYGKAIFIKNGNTYTTVYGHLSRYARGSHKGSRVKQGQIIGYVGSTGLATGPHLHYELRINGVHRNPLTAKLPKAKPIARKYRQDFQQHAKPWLAHLALINPTRLASTSAMNSSINKDTLPN